MAGRRPSPTAMKVLAGNPGHRPLNAEEPQPPKGVPEMPKGMARVARREWKMVTRELSILGLLTIVDGKALGEYCKLMGLAEVYYNEALQEPMVEEPVFDKTGMSVGTKIKANPATAAYLGCSKAAKAYLIEFGLTPASRTKLKIQKPKEVDPFEAMLNSRTGVQPMPEQPGNKPSPVAFDTGKISEDSTSFDA